MATGLDVSRIITTSVNLAPLAAQFANVDSLLIMGDSTVIDVAQRIRSYNGLDEVAADFGTSAPEYLAADNFFSQKPAPTQLYIGRWAHAATPGILHGGSLSATQQALANFTAITSGGFSVTIDGSVHHLASINLSGATNLNGVATLVQAALPSGVLCIWGAVNQRFDIISSTTGTSSTLSFATAPSSGTDISALLGLTSTQGGNLVGGIAAESALTAVTILDDLTTQWYGLMFASPDIVDGDSTSIAAYIEATFHIFGISTQEASALNPNTSSDIGSLIMAGGYTRTFVQYSSSSPYAVASMFGREFTVDFNANNSTITLMFKQEPGVIPETLTATQADTLTAKRYNYFVNYDNNTAIIQNGVMGGPAYIDEIHGLDWLANAIQTNLYNQLYQSPTKIPQTDQGTHLLVTTVEATCAGAVNNGLVAPGTWTTQGFGTLNEGDFMPTGYYVYAPPVSTQASADRAARKSVPIQVAVKLAGAIQSVDCIINVNR